MNDAFQEELGALVSAYVPSDSDPVLMNQIRAQWTSIIGSARAVRLTSVDDYGPKLEARWEDAGGNIVGKMAVPPARAERLWEFADRWAELMNGHGTPVRVLGTKSSES